MEDESNTLTTKLLDDDNGHDEVVVKLAPEEGGEGEGTCQED